MQNLRTEDHITLRKANAAYNECIMKSFMPQWLSGSNLTITDVCTEEREALQEADGVIFEDPLPFKKFTLPSAGEQ